MLGKYSPTVSQAYSQNQQWWNEHLNSPLENWDKDGYDSYGYNEKGIDRAGIHEDEYPLKEELYNHLTLIWGFDGEKPKLKEVEIPQKIMEVEAFLNKLENDAEIMAIFKRLSLK